FLWIDGSRSSTSPPDLYLLGSGGLWEHFDGVHWKVLHRFTRTMDPGGEFRGATLRVGRSEALAGKGSDLGLVRSRGGTVGAGRPGALGRESFSGLGLVPGMGLIAGSSTGTLYVDRGDGRWASLDALDQLDRGFRSIVPYDDGFMTGGDMGYV